jgi:hypothetical protein
MRTLPVFPIVASLVASLPAAGRAGVTVEGVSFPAVQVVAGERLELRGAALLRWRSLLDAYVAALYLPPEVAAGEALGDVPRRLEIEYFRAIAAEDLGRAASAILRRSLEPARFAALRERLDELHARYEAVEPGDRYALSYRPGIGTELARNGRPLATVPGADFAAAYFGLWLGHDPIDARLRDGLLGGSPTRARERATR